MPTEDDLLALTSRDVPLRRVASTAGGEWAGPCPFCGGRDRFRVWPNHPSGKGRWWCRQCGRHGDALDYLRERDGLSYREARERLGFSAPAGPSPLARQRPPLPSCWQERAWLHVRRCEELLWSPAGKAMLTYLREMRGLKDETIRRFRLGYNPSNVYENPALWGLDGRKVFLGRGVVIPHVLGENIYGVKVRLLPPANWDGRLVKYVNCRGSVPVLFGADGLRGDGRPLLLCEGEFDAMLAWQEAGDLVDVATPSSARGSIPPEWYIYLLAYRHILVAYDADTAGETAVARLSEQIKRVVAVTVPKGGDICGFWQAGGDLRAWVGLHLAQTPPTPSDPDPLVSYAVRELGAVVRYAGE